MACSTQTSSIVLEAVTVNYGFEQKLCFSPVVGLAGGEYFEYSTPSVDYYVWFTVNAIGSDPAIVGKTGIEVTLATSYTVADAIVAIDAAIEALKFTYVEASTDGLSIKLTNAEIGAGLSVATIGDSGFTLDVISLGSNLDLGATKSGLEVSFESTLFDIKSNQTAELLLGQVIQGTSASMTMDLLEVSKEKLALLIGEGIGDTFTPSGGTQLVGFGTSKNFKSSLEFAGRVVLHPIRLVTSDKTEDVTFWRTMPQPDSINYDGLETKALSITMSALVDDTKPKEISIYAIGDSSQFLV